MVDVISQIANLRLLKHQPVSCGLRLSRHIVLFFEPRVSFLVYEAYVFLVYEAIHFWVYKVFSVVLNLVPIFIHYTKRCVSTLESSQAFG